MEPIKQRQNDIVRASQDAQEKEEMTKIVNERISCIHLAANKVLLTFLESEHRRKSLWSTHVSP